jgi:hypothetical protein
MKRQKLTELQKLHVLAPLRRIVSRQFSAAGSPTETLECGHVVHERQDYIGSTNAVKRRCKMCLAHARGEK